MSRPLVPEELDAMGFHFTCPICGNGHYEEHTENNGVRGPGYFSWVTHYSCKGCSVMFEDLLRFSKTKP